MWYEIITPGIVVAACIAAPQYICWWSCKAFFDNHFRRDLNSHWGRLMFLRDYDIDGAVWKVRGLENIPDSDDSPSSSKANATASK